MPISVLHYYFYHVCRSYLALTNYFYGLGISNFSLGEREKERELLACVRLSARCLIWRVFFVAGEITSRPSRRWSERGRRGKSIIKVTLRARPRLGPDHAIAVAIQVGYLLVSQRVILKQQRTGVVAGIREKQYECIVGDRNGVSVLRILRISVKTLKYFLVPDLFGSTKHCEKTYYIT